jgi:hypothetical protein
MRKTGFADVRFNSGSFTFAAFDVEVIFCVFTAAI